jgi:hypothetical protein
MRHRVRAAVLLVKHEKIRHGSLSSVNRAEPPALLNRENRIVLGFGSMFCAIIG